MADGDSPRPDSEGEFQLFWVHSNLTWLVAQAVIAHRRFAPAEVGLVTTRGYRPPAPSADGGLPALLDLGVDLLPKGKRKRLNMLQGWRRLASVDAQLSELCGGRRYHFHTPQTLEPIAQVIKNSRACSGFSYIEEGLYSYCTAAEMARSHAPRRAKRWERLAYRNRIRDAQFFDPGQRHAYGVADAVFPGMDGKVVLDGVFSPANAQQTAGVAHVLVFDSLAVAGRVALDTLVAAVERLLQRLGDQRVGVLHYKLHPAQLGSAEQQRLEAVLSSAAIAVQRLDDDIALEGLALASPQTCFYVNLSSVGLYAALFGARVYSFAGWVAAIEPAFARYIALSPQVFAERVTMLE